MIFCDEHGTADYCPECVDNERIAELEAENDAWADKWMQERKENERQRKALQKILDGSPPGDCWIRKSQIEAALGGE